ncbi:MAG: ABC-F family ATP-binding cassette domain-containing protein [Anaerolineae bacterium]|jgi:ATP-binding cassette subfamily F protein 3|nr:ABC-F family ATP-binding cassette domain-containing protein [Anaerolineae bacterium]
MSTIIVKLDNITLQHGAVPVLSGISWEIQAGQKIGLVGANGAGKSTLLQIVAGVLLPDQGVIFRHPELRIGYLAQEPQLDPKQSAWEAVVSANVTLERLEVEMRRLESRMADPEVYGNEVALARVLAAHARAQAAFEEQDGYRYESRCEQVLQSVGFDSADFNLPIQVLSGGQRKMVGLARLLALDCNLLLLDEPDNHLDLAGKRRLETFIQEFPGAVVIVSHDRYLLDETVNRISEIEDRQLVEYLGNFSAHATEKQLRLLRQQQLYAAQQKEITRIEAAIARFEYWASIVIDERHIRQARHRQKMLDRMDKIEKPVLEREHMGLELNGWRGSNKVLEIADLDKSFHAPDGSEDIVLLGLNLLIWHGERVGLLGENGAGKSVLLRCILGNEEPTSGVINIGPSVRIGYYAQQHETLDPNRTLIEEIWDAKSIPEQAAVSVLRRFLFPYLRVRDRVAQLSGGERSRLQLAKLMLSGANFLLLDEPTNNLDLPSCEVLEQALDEFEGTVLVISHDRYFLDRVVERIVELEDGMLHEYPGDYTTYAEKKLQWQNWLDSSKKPLCLSQQV